VNIRSATTADIEDVLAFWERAAARHSLVDEASGLERLLRRDPEALLIAEEEGALVGTLAVGWDGWRCHLYRLAVDPDHRRRGIARLLLQAGTERAAGVGAPRLDAVVLTDNDDGQDFWRTEGFTRDDDLARWSRLIEPRRDTS
jgi:ribosomal protein S18 acetylase RimI-like enzyme